MMMVVAVVMERDAVELMERIYQLRPGRRQTTVQGNPRHCP